MHWDLQCFNRCGAWTETGFVYIQIQLIVWQWRSFIQLSKKKIKASFHRWQNISGDFKHLRFMQCFISCYLIWIPMKKVGEKYFCLLWVSRKETGNDDLKNSSTGFELFCLKNRNSNNCGLNFLRFVRNESKIVFQWQVGLTKQVNPFWPRADLI